MARFGEIFNFNSTTKTFTLNSSWSNSSLGDGNDLIIAGYDINNYLGFDLSNLPELNDIRLLTEHEYLIDQGHRVNLLKGNALKINGSPNIILTKDTVSNLAELSIDSKQFQTHAKALKDFEGELTVDGKELKKEVKKALITAMNTGTLTVPENLKLEDMKGLLEVANSIEGIANIDLTIPSNLTNEGVKALWELTDGKNITKLDISKNKTIKSIENSKNFKEGTVLNLTAMQFNHPDSKLEGFKGELAVTDARNKDNTSQKLTSDKAKNHIKDDELIIPNQVDAEDLKALLRNPKLTDKNFKELVSYNTQTQNFFKSTKSLNLSGTKVKSLKPLNNIGEQSSVSYQYSADLIKDLDISNTQIDTLEGIGIQVLDTLSIDLTQLTNNKEALKDFKGKLTVNETQLSKEATKDLVKALDDKTLTVSEEVYDVANLLKVAGSMEDITISLSKKQITNNKEAFKDFEGKLMVDGKELTELKKIKGESKAGALFSSKQLEAKADEIAKIDISDNKTDIGEYEKVIKKDKTDVRSEEGRNEINLPEINDSIQQAIAQEEANAKEQAKQAEQADKGELKEINGESKAETILEGAKDKELKAKEKEGNINQDELNDDIDRQQMKAMGEEEEKGELKKINGENKAGAIFSLKEERELKAEAKKTEELAEAEKTEELAEAEKTEELAEAEKTEELAEAKAKRNGVIGALIGGVGIITAYKAFTSPNTSSGVKIFGGLVAGALIGAGVSAIVIGAGIGVGAIAGTIAIGAGIGAGVGLIAGGVVAAFTSGTNKTQNQAQDKSQEKDKSQGQSQDINQQSNIKQSPKVKKTVTFTGQNDIIESEQSDKHHLSQEGEFPLDLNQAQDRSNTLSNSSGAVDLNEISSSENSKRSDSVLSERKKLQSVVQSSEDQQSKNSNIDTKSQSSDGRSSQ